MTTSAVGSSVEPPMSSNGTISGNVHGGQQPVYNAIVNLYSAGTTGYGSQSTLLATTTSDINGDFQFTKLPNGSVGSGSSWACPAGDPDPDPQIYITAVGGNTQGTGVTTTNNAASALVAAIGPCSLVTTSTRVLLNELTTAATVIALAQYINPGSGPGTASIGTNGSNTLSNTPQAATGLNNAVAGVANLVAVASGGSVASNTYTGSNPTVTGVTVTATPETAKLVTIANILAACVNSTASNSTNCADLFASASPPPTASVTSQPAATFTAAQDTIQAAYYMATNPINAGTFTSCSTAATTKISCLFNLASSKPPFQTGLGVAPLDWTLGIAYTATGTCSNGYPFLLGPKKAATDAYGNLWFINGSTTSGSNTDNFAALSPVGVPLFCAGGTINGQYITIDTAGNIWAAFGTTSNGIQQLAAPGSIPTASAVTTVSNATAIPQTITADGYGNVFYANLGTVTNIYEIPSGGTTTSSTVIATGVAKSPLDMAVDSAGRIYVGNSSGSSPDNAIEISPPVAAITGYTITGTSSPYTIKFNATNTFVTTGGQTVIVSGLASMLRQQFVVTSATSTTFTATTTLSPTSGTVADSGIAAVEPTGPASYTNIVSNNITSSAAYGLAVDQNNNVYLGTTCCGTTGNTEKLYKVSVSASDTSIASATGNYSSSAQFIGCSTGFRAVALDGADNVWFTNEMASADGGLPESETSGTFGIGEIATSGNGSTATFTALSPAPTGLQGTDTCSSTLGCPVGGAFQKSSLTYSVGMSIDPSGNVWVLNNGYTISASQNTGTSITEIVGAAVPVVTPLSIAAANDTEATEPGSTPATPVLPFVPTNPEPVPSGPITVANLTVAPQSIGTVGPQYMGLSMGKDTVYSELYRTQTIAGLFGTLSSNGTSMLRIGGTDVDTLTWTTTGPNSVGHVQYYLSPPDVDALALFLKKTGWSCLYGINFLGYYTDSPGDVGYTTPALAASEATYVANALGSSLYGFEIGNEPDLAYGQHLGWSLSQYEANWTTFYNAIHAAVPGALMTGPSASGTSWTVPFGQYATKNEIGLLTQHYYEDELQNSSDTASWLVNNPETQYNTIASTVNSGAMSIGIPWRGEEVGDSDNDTLSGIADGYGSALWVIDFAFNNVTHGAAGINMYEPGGNETGTYSPISFSTGTGATVAVHPEFYGMTLFTMAGQGTLYQTTFSGIGSLNESAYAIETASGGLNLIVSNKDPSQNLQVLAQLPQTIHSASLIEMTQLSSGATGPDITATGGVTIQGSSIGLDGTFTPASGYGLSFTGSEVSFYVPALSAVLIKIQ